MDNIIKYVYLILGAVMIVYLMIFPIIIYIHSVKSKNMNAKLLAEKEEIDAKYVEEIAMLESDHKNQIELIERSHADTINNMNHAPLTFEDINEIIAAVMDELWVNKYYMNYYLRDAAVVPDVDKDIANFSKEVFSALSQNVVDNALKYYKFDYLIEKITRQSTVIFMDYIKKNKPPSK